VRWPPLITEFPTGITPPSPFPGPPGITAGPDSNLWFTDGARVAKMTTAGKVSPFAVNALYSDLAQITVGPNGNLWFTEFGCDKVGEVTPAGMVSEFPIPGGDTTCSVPQFGPEGITAGPDGNLWFTEYRANQVAKMTTRGFLIGEYSIGDMNTGYINPWGIAASPDGNLWVTVGSPSPPSSDHPLPNGLAKVTLNGLVSKVPLPDNAGPWGIAVGPDGNLWVIEQFANKVAKVTPAGVVSGEYNIPTANAGAWAIAAGPDGNLWFTERGANQVAVMTTTGWVIEFPVPTANSGPEGITVGPDGYIWFTEYYANKVARLGPLAPAP
jgi:streptogramin lyase